MDRQAEHRLRDVKSIGSQKNIPMLRGVASSKKAENGFLMDLGQAESSHFLSKKLTFF